MSEDELAARIVLRPSASMGFEDIRRIARDELAVTDEGQVGDVAQRLYEMGWLERCAVTADAIDAKLGARRRAIAQSVGPVEELTRSFERGGSLVVDPRQSLTGNTRPGDNRP